MKTAVITGASTGIGAATAKVLIDNGWKVFGSVRNKKDGDRLVQQHGDKFEPLIFDVMDEKAVNASAAVVKKALNGRNLDALVNNAGIALSDPLLEQTMEDFQTQINVNVVGLFATTKAFVPLLGIDKDLAGGPGRVVNISSTAGKIGFPFLAAYSASKHAVEGLSEGLRRELMLYGIDVVIVGPGFVKTPIWDKAEAVTKDHIKSTDWEQPVTDFTEFMLESGRNGITAESIGETVLTALTSAKPKARYSSVQSGFMNFTLPTKLPARVVDKIFAKQIGIKRVER